MKDTSIKISYPYKCFKETRDFSWTNKACDETRGPK